MSDPRPAQEAAGASVHPNGLRSTNGEYCLKELELGEASFEKHGDESLGEVHLAGQQSHE